jgi:hypothetical protein
VCGFEADSGYKRCTMFGWQYSRRDCEQCVVTSFTMRKIRLAKRHFPSMLRPSCFVFSLDPRADPVKSGHLYERLEIAGCRSCRIFIASQRGSICGSNMGPIRVFWGCFPLFRASINSAKLIKMRYLLGLVRFETVDQFEVTTSDLFSVTCLARSKLLYRYLCGPIYGTWSL